MLGGSLMAASAASLGRYMLLALSFTVGVAVPAVAAGYGDCQVTGEKGAYHITPATPGQLTVEVSLPAPGWWNGDTPDTIKDGYEYCMAAEIAYRAGLDKVAVVNVSWAQLIGGHTTNYDLALSEASITEPRKKVVDFSTPYFSSDIGILVKKGTKTDSASVKAMRIGVHQGTTGADFITNVVKPSSPPREYPNVPAMMAALNAGQIDAAADDTAYMLGYAAASKGTLEVGGQVQDRRELRGGLSEGIGERSDVRQDDPVVAGRRHAAEAGHQIPGRGVGGRSDEGSLYDAVTGRR